MKRGIFFANVGLLFVNRSVFPSVGRPNYSAHYVECFYRRSFIFHMLIVFGEDKTNLNFVFNGSKVNVKKSLLLNMYHLIILLLILQGFHISNSDWS